MSPNCVLFLFLAGHQLPYVENHCFKPNNFDCRKLATTMTPTIVTVPVPVIASGKNTFVMESQTALGHQVSISFLSSNVPKSLAVFELLGMKMVHNEFYFGPQVTLQQTKPTVIGNYEGFDSNDVLALNQYLKLI